MSLDTDKRVNLDPDRLAYKFTNWIINTFGKKPTFIDDEPLYKISKKFLHSPIPRNDRKNLIFYPNNIINNKEYMNIDNTFIKTLVIQEQPENLDEGFYIEILNYKQIRYKIEKIIIPQNPKVEKERLRISRRNLKNRILEKQKANQDVDDEMEMYNDQHTARYMISTNKDKPYEEQLVIIIIANTEKELEKTSRLAVKLLDRAGVSVEEIKGSHETILRGTFPGISSNIIPKISLLGENLTDQYSFITSTFKIDESVGIIGVDASGQPTTLNRKDNINYFCLETASSGSGKTVASRKDLYAATAFDDDFSFLFLDPNNEYEEDTKAFDGIYVKLGEESKNTFNPLDPLGMDLELAKELNLMMIRSFTSTITDAQIMVIKTMHDIAFLEAGYPKNYGKPNYTINESDKQIKSPTFTKMYDILKKLLFDLESKSAIKNATKEKEIKLYYPDFSFRINDKRSVLAVMNIIDQFLPGRRYDFLSKETNFDPTTEKLGIGIQGFDDKKILGGVLFKILSVTLKKQMMKREELKRKMIPLKKFIINFDEFQYASMGNEEIKTWIAGLSLIARKFEIHATLIAQLFNAFGDPKSNESPLITNSGEKRFMKMDEADALAIATRYRLSKPETDRLMSLGKGEALIIRDDEKEGRKRKFIRFLMSEGTLEMFESNSTKVRANAIKNQQRKAIIADRMIAIYKKHFSSDTETIDKLNELQEKKTLTKTDKEEKEILVRKIFKELYDKLTLKEVIKFDYYVAKESLNKGKEEELKDKIKEREKEEYEELFKQNTKVLKPLYKINDDHITYEQKEFLKKNGFVLVKFAFATRNNEDYYIKAFTHVKKQPITQEIADQYNNPATRTHMDENLRHTIEHHMLQFIIARALRFHTSDKNIKIHDTKTADIEFEFVDNLNRKQIYAYEIETGSNIDHDEKSIVHKLKTNDKEFGKNNWFFVIIRQKDLKDKYIKEIMFNTNRTYEEAENMVLLRTDIEEQLNYLFRNKI